MSEQPGIPTAENIRFHAAGHIAAAIILINDGQAKAASVILKEVFAYVCHEKVDAPMALKTKVMASISEPAGSLGDLQILEQWFCDPLNSVIEKSGQMN